MSQIRSDPAVCRFLIPCYAVFEEKYDAAREKLDSLIQSVEEIAVGDRAIRPPLLPPITRARYASNGAGYSGESLGPVVVLAADTLELNRRTFRRAERTEHAAVSRIWSQ